MKSSIEPQEGNKVKISVTIEAEEFEPAIAAAWQAIAREVRIPGFRPGKAPRKVLEARIEPGYARSEAINKAVPEFYFRAVREHDVDAIDQPDVEVTGGEEDGDVTFDAVVEVRPEISLSGYEGLTIEVPNPIPSDDDVTEQIDRLRGQYGDLVAVERPVQRDDYVTIDLSAKQGDEVVEGLTVDNYSYVVGSGVIVPELDDHLVGAEVDNELSFTAPHPREGEDPVDFSVTVRGVKEQQLPDLTDAWVSDATEFGSVADFRDDVVERLSAARTSEASVAVQNGPGDKLADLVLDEVP
ncbi:MAG TPA: trigger factor, partial [Microthrixaceae bacterium]|nr:trigger factor [Microthrixaceae bacterium]